MPGKTSFTIAPARAGKSTFWNNWLATPDPDGLNKVVLCRDEFRLADYGERFNASREKGMHEKFDVAWRALHNSQRYHLGLDETNTTVKSIRNILRMDINATAIFINTPIDVCKERAYASGQPDLVEKEVIDRMFDNLIKLCNYRVSKYAMIPAGRYDLIRESYIYESVRKIREEVLEENNNASRCQSDVDR